MPVRMLARPCIEEIFPTQRMWMSLGDNCFFMDDSSGYSITESRYDHHYKFSCMC